MYRILRLERLYEIFAEEQNVLAKPESWDDPYENLRSRLEGSVSNHCCYGQCWTLQRASDAMWRIYSPMVDGGSRKYAVRIRSTIRCLVESLRRSSESSDSAFIGRVQYLNTPRLIKYVKHAPCSSSKSMAKILLVKRPAFRHEREVRLLLIARSEISKLFRYRVEPTRLISQIMLDPRLDREEAGALKKEIRDRTGFPGPIKRSLLYAPPEL